MALIDFMVVSLILTYFINSHQALALRAELKYLTLALSRPDDAFNVPADHKFSKGKDFNTVGVGFDSSSYVNVQDHEN